MLPLHNFHQPQYPSSEPSWQQLHHQQQPQHLHHHHAQAQQQAAAAAAQAAQQQHYNRIAAAAAGGGNLNTGQGDSGGGGGVRGGSGPDERHGSQALAGFNDSAVGGQEERRILEWIAQLLVPATREGALLELSKKREQFPQLALILWHSFGKYLRFDDLCWHEYG